MGIRSSSFRLLRGMAGRGNRGRPDGAPEDRAVGLLCPALLTDPVASRVRSAVGEEPLEDPEEPLGRFLDHEVAGARHGDPLEPGCDSAEGGGQVQSG